MHGCLCRCRLLPWCMSSTLPDLPHGEKIRQVPFHFAKYLELHIGSCLFGLCCRSSSQIAKLKLCADFPNCMLYYKDNISKEKCDVCGTSRYEEGHDRVPRKVLRYLPIKDRLQRLYAHETTAKLM